MVVPAGGASSSAMGGGTDGMNGGSGGGGAEIAVEPAHANGGGALNGVVMNGAENGSESAATPERVGAMHAFHQNSTMPPTHTLAGKDDGGGGGRPRRFPRSRSHTVGSGGRGSSDASAAHAATAVRAAASGGAVAGGAEGGDSAGFGFPTTTPGAGLGGGAGESRLGGRAATAPSHFPAQFNGQQRRSSWTPSSSANSSREMGFDAGNRKGLPSPAENSSGSSTSSFRKKSGQMRNKVLRLSVKKNQGKLYRPDSFEMRFSSTAPTTREDLQEAKLQKLRAALVAQGGDPEGAAAGSPVLPVMVATTRSGEEVIGEDKEKKSKKQQQQRRREAALARGGEDDVSMSSSNASTSRRKGLQTAADGGSDDSSLATPAGDDTGSEMVELVEIVDGHAVNGLPAGGSTSAASDKHSQGGGGDGGRMSTLAAAGGGDGGNGSGGEGEDEGNFSDSDDDDDDDGSSDAGNKKSVGDDINAPAGKGVSVEGMRDVVDQEQSGCLACLHALWWRVRNVTIEPRSTWFYGWTGLIAMIVLAEVWSLIARVAWPEINDDHLAVWIPLDYTFDLLFILDVFARGKIRFIGAETGLTVKEAPLCWSNYRRSFVFYLDVGSLLPLDLFYFAVGNVRPVFRFVRLLKFPRLLEFLTHYENGSSSPNSVRIGKITLGFITCVHWVAGFYFLISRSIGFGQDAWVYPLPIGEFGEVSRMYVFSLYWATVTLTSIGGSELPETNAEYAFNLVVVIIGVFLFAIVVGNLGSMITNINASANAHRNNMDALRAYMKVKKVRPALQDRVLRYMDYTWDKQAVTGSSDMLRLLPVTLQTDIAIQTNLQTLKKIPLFYDCEPGLLHDLVLKLKTLIFSPQEYICRKGEVGRDMYIVHTGIADVCSEDGSIVFVSFGAGRYFGDLSLLHDCMEGQSNRRSAHVRARGFTMLLALSKQDLDASLADYPEARDVMVSNAKTVVAEMARRKAEKDGPPPKKDGGEEEEKEEEKVGGGAEGAAGLLTAGQGVDSAGAAADVDLSTRLQALQQQIAHLSAALLSRSAPTAAAASFAEPVDQDAPVPLHVTASHASRRLLRLSGSLPGFLPAVAEDELNWERALVNALRQVPEHVTFGTVNEVVFSVMGSRNLAMQAYSMQHQQQRRQEQLGLSPRGSRVTGGAEFGLGAYGDDDESDDPELPTGTHFDLDWPAGLRTSLDSPASTSFGELSLSPGTAKRGEAGLAKSGSPTSSDDDNNLLNQSSV